MIKYLKRKEKIFYLFRRTIVANKHYYAMFVYTVIYIKTCYTDGNSNSRFLFNQKKLFCK